MKTLTLICCLFVVVSAVQVQAASPVVEVRIMPSRVDAVADHRGPYTELSELFVEVVDWIALNGWYPTDRGVGLYHDDPSSVPAARLRSQARVPLNVFGKTLPVPEGGPAKVYVERMPPQLVISTKFTGPYRKIIPTYGFLHRQLAKYDLRYTGPMLERYLNDPQTTNEDELLTEVNLVVEPRSKVDIGLYCDWGGFPSGIEAASLCFTQAGLTIRPVMASDINDGSFRKQIRVLYMPGGWAEHYVRDIDENGARNLEKFVSDGGGYIGICAGSYYAANEICWAGKNWPYDINLFPGVPTGPIDAIAPWPEYATTVLNLSNDHPITKNLPPTRTSLYYGGPILQADESAEVSVLAKFDQTGKPAIVSFNKGKGRVFLSSVHLEFDLTCNMDRCKWPENEKGIDDPECDWDMLQSAAKWVLGKD